MSRKNDFIEIRGILEKIRQHIDDLLTSSDAEVHELLITLQDVYLEIFPKEKK